LSDFITVLRIANNHTLTTIMYLVPCSFFQ